jgi:DnaJ-class molecular chaperone
MFFKFPFGPGAGMGNSNGVFFDTRYDGDGGYVDDDGGDDFSYAPPNVGYENDTDYYKVLNIDEKASEDEIKKAYRRLSMLHHPDKNGNTEESKLAFQELNNAYATLSDPNKRRTYDRMRKGGGGDAFPGIHPSMFHFGGGGGVPGGFPPGIPEELLHMLFGGGGGAGMGGAQGPKVVFQAFHNGRPMGGGGVQQHQPQQPQPPTHPQQQSSPHIRVYQVPDTIIKTVSLTLEQCYNGCSIPLEIDRQSPDNDIVKIERETLHVQIPKGVHSGDNIILNDCGHMNEAGMKGDVRIIVNTLQHPVFKVENLDLTIEKTISLKSALCGFDFEIAHINGRVFKLANKPGNIIKPGSVQTIPGLGLEKNGETGCLKIRFTVDFPEVLTQEQISALQVGL